MAEQTSTFIGRLRQELEAATPGPWEATVVRPGHALDLADKVVLATVANGWEGDKFLYVTCADDERLATARPRIHDATLIANAPTYLAALLDVAELVREAGYLCDHIPDGTVLPAGEEWPRCGACGTCKINDAVERVGALGSANPQIHADTRLSEEDQ